MLEKKWVELEVEGSHNTVACRAGLEEENWVELEVDQWV